MQNQDVGVSSFNEGLGDTILPILRGRGVILNGCETDDMSPMNPEGTEVDVYQGGCPLINGDIR